MRARPAPVKEGPRANEEIIEGFLCINNQNIENKRFERFFFRKNKQRTQTPVTVPLPEDVRARYADLIRDYQTRHSRTVESWQKQKNPKTPPDKPRRRRDAKGRVIPESAFSRFIIGGQAAVLGVFEDA